MILAVEFFLLCLVVPGIIIWGGYAEQMFAFLWAAAAYTFVVYYRNHFNGWRDFWRWDAVRWKNLKPVLVRWIFACVAMLVFLYFYNPDRMFGLWRERPEIIPYLLVFYPLASALPQEFIFCAFFFKRYQPFFGKGALMVLASAVVFAYAHVLYINPVAPVISFFGGLIFAMTYRKHGSLALVTIEHALYGAALFLIGLGRYFYSGGVGAGP